MTYPRPLRLIHWTVAILVTCQLALAVVLTQLRSLPRPENRPTDRADVADMVQTAAVIGEQANHLRDQVGRFVLNLRSASSSAPTPPAQSSPPRTVEYDEPERLRAVAS